MSALLGKLSGSRGELTRAGSRDSGMLASVQSWSSRITVEWTWDRLSQTWTVEIRRDLVRPGTKDQPQVLWKGAVAE